ncbi:MAG: ABC transporter permease subunit [Pseudorhodoplanes sp.]|nr:ABC transporter permease subunit [Pseudorhodoplanes sp.]
MSEPTHSRNSRLIILVPYLWLIAFLLAPFLIVLKLSLSQSAMSQPPYAPLLDLAEGLAGLRAFIEALSLDNYRTLFFDTLYIASFLKSLEIALISTLLLMAAALPIAYGLSRMPRAWQPALLVVIMLPFWTAFLIRIYAWITILQREGLFNHLLIALRIIDEPIPILASNTAVYIGIVYSYLPFMVLPVYAVLSKMDDSLLDAAADLGCPRWKTFWLVTVPLARPGLFAGALICFIPIVGEFIIPDLLGDSRTVMIGQTLWTEFFANRDWPVAPALAMALLVALLIPIMIVQRMQNIEVRR